MRVLVLTPSLPLPFDLNVSRWVYVVTTELSRRGHDVRCITCGDADDTAVAQAEEIAAEHGFGFSFVPLRIDEQVVVRKLRSLRRPYSEYLRVPGLADLLAAELARAPDIVHVEHLFTTWPVATHPRVVPYVHNLDVADWQGRTGMTFSERIRFVQMSRATRQLARRVPRAVAGTPRVAAELRQRNPGLETRVAPLSIDPALYEPIGPSAHPTIGLLGSMWWLPSRAAALRLLSLWPHIRERVPSAELLVGGWASDRHLGHLFPLEGATLVGGVSDPREFFSQIRGLIYAPPLGTGVKLKVLEAMAYGVPVVSNATGFEGLSVADGSEGLAAETDDEFVAAASELLTDAGRAREIGLAGRALLEREYAPAPALDRLLAAWEALLPR